MRNAVSRLTFLGIITLLSTLAIAMDKPRVEDNAGFFSPNALNQANERIAEIKKVHGKDVYIETHASIPAEMQSQFRPEQRQQFFEQWANQRAKEMKVDGVMVLISREPSYLQVSAGRDTSRQAFLSQNIAQMRQVMQEQFRSQRFDQGLLAGVDYVKSTFAQSLPARGAGTAAGAAGQSPQAAPSGRTSGAETPAPAPTGRTTQRSPFGGMTSWICIGFAVVMVFLVMRAMRARQAQYGQPGMGRYGSPNDPNAQNRGQYDPQTGQPGHGGYTPAPRGGGFGGGLLGGLLGGVLGGAAYDRFMRPGGGTGGADPGAMGGAGDAGGAAEPPPSSDIGGDFTGSGGDWGGGDAGGGGDFGGGDGGGGGGDF